MNMGTKYNITDLSQALSHATITYMEKLASSLQAKDKDAWRQLDHRDPKETVSTRRNDDAYRSGLMKKDLRVVAWRAKPYKQPRWQIFKEYRFEPEPIVWVDVDLGSECGKHTDDIFAVLGFSEEGKFKQCYYVPKE